MTRSIRLTDTPPKAAASPPAVVPRRPAIRIVAVAVLVAILLLGVAAAVLYLNRRAVARDVLVGWLDQRGIQADVEVERIEVDGFVGRVRIGDPQNPDVVVERAEVDYALALPWSRTGLGVTPSRIRLVRPVVRASWKGGRLSLGSLDPLVKEFTGGPPRPDSRGPLVVIEGGRGRLDTEYGPVEILADARIDDGKLMRLAARLPTAALKSGQTQAQGLSATLDLTTTGDRMALRLLAAADAFTTPAARGQGANLTLAGELPYPDLKTRRGDGRAVLDARLTGASLGTQALGARNADVTAQFEGQVSGWIETFRLDGATTTILKAASIEGADLRVSDVSATATKARLAVSRDDVLRWSVNGPLSLTAGAGRMGQTQVRGLALTARGLSFGGKDAAFEATGPVAATFDQFGFGDLTLKRGRADLDLDVVSDGGMQIAASGALRAADGAWPLFGAVGPDDIAELAEMKRALGGFALNAPSVRFSAGAAGTTVALPRPVVLTPANGGVLTVAQAGQGAYQAEAGRPGGGALSLTATRGKGLPEMTVAVPSWRLTQGGFEATLDGRARLDFDLARGIDARTRGVLALADGRLTYTTGDCVDLTVERLELDENDVHQVAGKLCPTGGPLLTSKAGAWRVAGGFDAVSAQAPFLGLRFADASGRVAVDGSKAGIGLTADVADARVIDALTPDRFEPLAASGRATLARERWSGAFDLKGTGAAAAYDLGRLTLAHDGRTGAGGIAVTAPNVTFADDGLQPAMLSPLVADFVQSPVEGSVAFDGLFDWTEEGEPTSSGHLVTQWLDFVSPVGAVKGLRGDIVFSSLTPLITAPNQKLTADSLAVGTAVTALDLNFSIGADGVLIDGAQVVAGGGTVSVEPFTVPLDAAQPYSGVIVLDRVQLGDIVADTGFDDKVLLDAVVSGRLPFIMDPKRGLKITAGKLEAVQPGRLSIKREVLTDVAASGGGGEVSENVVEDLAYQAMENLSFDQLSADVNSLDGGRIAVLFHIRGRHDPPQRQELRLTLSELISRRFLDRKLPLPSNTQIDLTLDTTLNANQLISDLLAVNRARQGQQAPDAPAQASAPAAQLAPAAAE